MDILSIKQRFGIVGNTEQLNYAIRIASQVASTTLSVLISGESGVGKEVFSKIIYQLGARKHEPFIAINCGAIPEGTIDSELFGHEKGAFTGAVDKRKGYFETVNGGTIFLDEIGEMPLSTQARLLRVLESGEFIKVGSSVVQKTDVRIIAATNVRLQQAIQKGKFREDLYYRLSTVPIHVPPLRDRGQDILLLFRKFSADIAEKNRTSPLKLDDSAKRIFLQYHWPGNIRQLKNMAEQLTILLKERVLDETSIAQYVPDMIKNKLPYVHDTYRKENSLNDKELIYKMLFEIKKDISDLKHIFINMSKGNLSSSYSQKSISTATLSKQAIPETYGESTYIDKLEETNKPIILSQEDSLDVNVEPIEDNLSIEEMEKDLIKKALKKHYGKRKMAANDLGISERTLYRKIKEYKIKE